jgi:hypothetical protein
MSLNNTYKCITAFQFNNGHGNKPVCWLYIHCYLVIKYMNNKKAVTEKRLSVVDRMHSPWYCDEVISRESMVGHPVLTTGRDGICFHTSGIELQINAMSAHLLYFWYD